MTIGPQTSLRDLAFIACTALDKAGVTAVLSGGGAATIYAPAAYQSRDLDFILQFASAMFPTSDEPLAKLGFRVRGGTYCHDQTSYTIEFPPGPLAIGSETVTKWDTLHEGENFLHILTPTDSVRDRLAWFLFNNDFSSLDQALAVARRHEIELDKVKAWCATEGHPEKFEIFKSRLDDND